MKMTALASQRRIIRILGSSNKLLTSYPKILGEDYLGVYDKFLTTTIAKEIIKEDGIPFVALAFVSYIQSIDPQFSRLNVLDLNSVNLQDCRSRVRNFLRKCRIQFPKIHEEYGFTYNNVDFIRALTDIKLIGYLSFAPAKGTLDAAMQDFVVGDLRSVPYQLRSGTYTYKQLLNMPNEWAVVSTSKDVDFYMARAVGNRLIVRYEFRLPDMVFYGSRRASDALKILNKSMKKVLS